MSNGQGQRTVLYSVVAPLFNECNNLRPLYDRLRPVLDRLAAGNWELILVDDGSADGSWSVINQIHQEDPRVIGLRFSRNFGHHTALTAGLDIARGDRVVTMDSDLQDLPEEVPKLASRMDEGFDLVYAERMNRRHSRGKRLGSFLFMWLLNALSEVPYPITGSVFRLMNRRFLDEFCRLRERHRLFTGLTSWLGFRQASVPVIHGERLAGQPTYSLRKMLLLAADSITAFSAKPLYYVVYVGATVSLLATLFGIYVVLRYYVTGYSTAGWASLMTAVTFFGGSTLLTLGIIGQYIARIFEHQKDRPMYIVQDTIGSYEAVSPASRSAVASPPARRHSEELSVTGSQFSRD